MAKNQKPFVKCLKPVLLAALVTVVFNIALSAILVAILNEFESQLIRNLISDVFSMVIYAIFLYRFHLLPRISTYLDHSQKLDLKGELMAYFRTEGKYIAIIYGVATLFRILVSDILPASPLAILQFFVSDMIMTPIFTHLYFPMILDSLMAFIYACALLCLLVVIRTRKIHQDDVGAKRR